MGLTNSRSNAGPRCTPAALLCLVLLTPLLLTQAACSGSGSGTASSLGIGAIANDSTTPSSVTTLPAIPPSTSTPGAQNTGAPNADFPFSGTFVVDEYSPSIINPEYEGIVEIVPSPLSKTRVLNGNLPRRYADGRTTYREGCGQSVSRITLAEPNGLSTPITPCSSEIPNEGASPTDFRQSNLSPDGTMVAVEARAFINSNYNYSTLVFEVASQTVLATWAGGYNSTWTPDGRLLMAADDGLYLLDVNLDNPAKLGTLINGPVGNPDVSADGTTIVFEFNQQIWGMDIDGSNPRELLTDGSRLRFPTWAPDGSPQIAYLAVPSDDKYYGYIFAADFENGQAYGLDLAPVLEFGSSNFLRTINGPLSWNP